MAATSGTSKRGARRDGSARDPADVPGAKKAIDRAFMRSKFVPERAFSVIHTWYSFQASGQGRRAEALSGDLRLARRIAAGFPTKAVEDVISAGLLEPQVAYDIIVSRRTLADRKQKEKPLSPEQSDRLARVLRIYARAEDAIGDMSRAFRWLHKDNRALDGKRPIDLLGSDAGTRAVEKVLGRIEHGIAS